MDQRLTIKDHIKEIHQFTARIALATFIGFILMVIIVYRMVTLQVVEHDRFTTLSENNRVTIVPIPPPRGIIYDRNGFILVQNAPSFALEIIPERTKDIPALIAELQKIMTISPDQINRFERLRRKQRRFETIPLKLNLSEEEVAKFSLNRHLYIGAEINSRFNRHYPLTTTVSHALGHVGRIDDGDLPNIDESNYAGTMHIGKLGIEKQYESILHGKVGYEEVETDARGRKLRVLKVTQPKPGQNVYLTIDIRVQVAAEQALGNRRGAVVAVNPNNGEILALASLPGFDPHLFVNGIDPQTYVELQNSIDRPLYNRALRGQYPPGSIIKPFMALAGLENDVITTDKKLICKGKFYLRGVDRAWRDWKKQGHGTVDMDKAIVQSCDIYFYDLAVNLSIDRIYSFLNLFGFGMKTGIDLLEENTGLLPSREWKRKMRNDGWYLGETVNIGIGQGYLLVTPLQMAVTTATLASRGIRHQPRLLYAVQEPEQKELRMQKSFQNTSIPIRDATHWDFVIKAMRNVVHTPAGTAFRTSKDIKYEMGGKTGTAQVVGIKQNETYDENKVDERLRDHALFIAFAPVDNPQIAVAVIVENGGHGGSAAAPVARAVIDQYLINNNSGP